MEIYDLINKLTDPINPIGETNYKESIEYFKNIQKWIEEVLDEI